VVNIIQSSMSLDGVRIDGCKRRIFPSWILTNLPLYYRKDRRRLYWISMLSIAKRYIGCMNSSRGNHYCSNNNTPLHQPTPVRNVWTRNKRTWIANVESGHSKKRWSNSMRTLIVVSKRIQIGREKSNLDSCV
jgi:hypothetical protein